MRRILYYIFLLLILTSCIYDTDLPVDESEEEIYLNVRMNTSPDTYSMSGNTAENRINTIDVLAFKVSGGGAYFDFHEKVDIIEPGNSINEKKFTVKLKKTSSFYYFVFIANARSEVENLYPISTMSSKDKVMAQLQFEANRWDINTVSSENIPMWGETKKPIQITAGYTLDSVYLLRSLARIDVLVDKSVTNFTLKEVYLYNRFTRGKIVPISTLWKWDLLRVIGPSLPEDYGKIKTRIKYDNITQNNFIETLYTFETDAVKQGDDLNATCLVVGGLYNTQDENDISYYRIDFADLVRDDEESGNEGPPGSGGGGGGAVGTVRKYLPLLRNHIHETKIIKVTKKGESNPDDAFNKKTEGLDVSIQSWDMNQITSDDNPIYRLRVNTDKLEVSVNSPGYITVDSNNPLPWEVQSQDSWIKVKRENDTTIKVEVENNPSDTGTILVKVANITKGITIKRVTL